MSEVDKPILVDTSVWIAYFRKEAEVYKRVNKFIDQQWVCLLGLILAELLQGCKSKKEMAVVRELGAVFPMLEERVGFWETAGQLAFDLRRKGLTIGLSDCYIAVVARENRAKVYTFDKHFKELHEFYGVELVLTV